MLDGLDQIVKHAWEGFKGFGNADTYLAAKLRHLKEEIRKWRRTKYIKEKKELIYIKETIHKLE